MPIPFALLDHCITANNIEEVLVHWEGQSPAKATWENKSWENKSLFQNQYPSFNLEDKICLKGVDNVTDGLSKKIEKRGKQNSSGPEDYAAPSDPTRKSKRVTRIPNKFRD